MTDKKSIKEITTMAKKLVDKKDLSKEITPEMQASIDAVASQIERLSGGDEDLKALMGQIKESIGKKPEEKA
jgi:hypothetical protein